MKARSLRSSCSGATAVFLLLFGAYWWLFRGRVEPPVEWLLALFGAVSILLLASSLIGFRKSFALARAIHGGAAGEPFRDGRLEAALGPIEAEGTPLRSPFRDRPCVAYEYEAKPLAAGGEGPADVAGTALTACVVRAPQGNVRLLGFPDLEAFPETPAEAESMAKVDAFLRSTKFEPVAGVSDTLEMVATLFDAAMSDKGTVREDWMIGTDRPQELDLSTRAFGERVVEVGQEVCALGTWSLARGGLSAAGGVLRLVPGDAARALRTVVRTDRLTAAAGLFFSVLIQGFLVAVYFLSSGR